MKTLKMQMLLLIGLMIFSLLFVRQAIAADGANDPIANDINMIQSRLDNIEKQNQEILAKDDKILEELDRLRVWVRRK